MRVRKRNGSFEPVDVNKIVRAVARCCVGLTEVDAMRVATKTISGLYDGATTAELDRLSIQTAALLTAEDPEYAKLGARLLATYIDKEVANQEIHSFSQSIAMGRRNGLIDENVATFVTANSRKLNSAIDRTGNDLFDFFGLRTLYDRYLLRHPETRDVIETPQYFFLRIASGIYPCPRRAGLLPIDFFARLSPQLAHPVQRRHAPATALLLLSIGFAARSTRRHLCEVHGRSAALEVRRRNRNCLPSRSFARIVDPGHERQVQRHHALAEDSGFFRGRCESRRQAQSGMLRVPGDLTRRSRRISRTAR